MDQAQIKYFDSDTASCIANLTRLPKASKDALDFSSQDLRKFNKLSAVKQLLHFIKEEKPFFEARLEPAHLRSIICVKGKHTNRRIAFQSGAFLLFGHDATLDEGGSPEISVQRISVQNKKGVLKQLDQLNINDSTVFPYIENSSKYIAQKFSFRAPIKSRDGFERSLILWERGFCESKIGALGKQGLASKDLARLLPQMAKQGDDGFFEGLAAECRPMADSVFRLSPKSALETRTVRGSIKMILALQAGWSAMRMLGKCV